MAEQPNDWATERAEQLVDKIRERTWSRGHGCGFSFFVSYGDAVELLAAHLRLIEAKGAHRGSKELGIALGVPAS